MRNDDDRAAEGVYTSAVARGARRRRRSLIGVAGVLSVLGVGGLIAAQMMDDRDTAPASRTGALEPPATLSMPSLGPSFDPVPVPSEAVVPSATVAPPASAATPRAVSPTASSAAPSSATPPPTTASRRVNAPMATVAPTSTQPRRSSRPPGGNAAAVDSSGVTTSTVRAGGGTLRISSARRDLTGYKELGWVADEGNKVGNARCTNKIRLSVDVDAKERPGLLLCWHTSAEKSVYTVAIRADGQPSAKTSVAAIDRQWAKLG